MPSVSDFRRGMTIIFKDDIYTITEFQHVNPGKGQAFIRAKLKNVKSGLVIDKSFRLSEKLEPVRLERREMQYLYNDDTNFYFMDMENYEQAAISSDIVGDNDKFLKDGIIAQILFHESDPVTVELPLSVELEVIEAEPAVRGDTAGNLTKMVTIETGAQIQVPPFIEQGDIIRIDTRTGKYISRV